ncbi:MAG: winged helix-turn-helix transcriptional regulator [Promethearchaeota archaeon]
MKMKWKRIIPLLIFMTIIIGLNITFVSAIPPLPDTANVSFKDKNGNGIDDRFERINERAIRVEHEVNQTIISSESKETSPKNEIKFIIQILNNKTVITVEYSSQPGIDPELKYRYEVLGILEYQDVNLDEIYDPENDIVLQNYTTQFNSNISHQKSIVDDLTIHYFQILTIDNVLQLNITAIEQFVKHNQITLVPNAMKFDIIINEFPFLSNTSRIALHCTIASEIEFSKKSEDDDIFEGIGEGENAITTQPEGANGIFSWTPAYLLDGEEKNVTMSSISFSDDGSEKLTEFYLNYGNGEYILHDPRLGIDGIYEFPQSLWWLYVLIGFGVLVVGTIGLTMSKEEYREYLINRILYREKNLHQLTVEQVLENKFRQKIIDIIIDQPGIHYRELLRLVGTSTSNLTWHLEVLVNYKIIHKQLIGKYLIYYPYLDKNPFADFDPTLVKSKTTLNIYQLIGDNPGIYQNKIANRMGLNHNTVKYHLDKLLNAKLIYIEQKGRKKLYHVIFEKDEITDNEK